VSHLTRVVPKTGICLWCVLSGLVISCGADESEPELRLSPFGKRRRGELHWLTKKIVTGTGQYRRPRKERVE
jgi:hypothetical protein